MTVAFLSSFMLVFMKAFQAKNVIGNHYISAFLTSFAIAVGEVGVIVSGATLGWSAVPYIGIGGAIGVVFAMLLHSRIFNKTVQ